MNTRHRLARIGTSACVAAGIALGLIGCQTADLAEHASERVRETEQPVFLNGQFEQGTHGSPPPSWTVTPYLNFGVNITTPQTRENLNLQPGGVPATVTWISAGGPESQVDPVLGASASLRWPKWENGVVIVNYGIANYNVNGMAQTMTMAAGDIDSIDGLAHVRFTVAPVLENPGHTAPEQPYYFVQLRNITKGTILYRDYNASAQPGVPWKSNASNSVYYTDWQLVDIAPGSAQLTIGDSVELEVIAGGCSQSGHNGRIYVDGVGASIPGLFISGTGPASANQGSNITYTLTYQNDGTGSANLPSMVFNTPAGTTFQSVSAPGTSCTAPAINGTGAVTCGMATLAPGGSGVMTVTVQIGAAVTGTITAGDYSISSTGVSPLIGPKVFTSVTVNVVYANLGITKSNGVGGVTWGSPVSYTIVASNAGPNTATGAVVTDTLSAQLTAATWTCAGAGGGTCPASGSGSINSNVTLPTGATATFTLNASVIAGSGTGSLSNTASIAVPAGITESAPVNNSANDTDPIGTLHTVTVAKSGVGAGSVTSAPAAISCGSTCVGSFLQGSNVVLTAAPDANSIFTGWSGACTGTGQCSLTIAGNTNVSASFAHANGAVCGAAGECGSGSCIDGVCCNTACGGGVATDCQACNVASAVGTCTPVAAATVCRASGGVCDIAETCNGSATTCPADTFASSATGCRASGGVCDVAETCTGSSATCPADGFVSSATTCRASNGSCDPLETCTGSAAACPADTLSPNTTVCRASGGLCDVVESCTGATPTCPADIVVPAGLICRGSAGVCDANEICNGASPACPADAFVSSASVCRAPAGLCDLGENCTGSAAACPADSLKASGVECRATNGLCDVAESCNGSSTACPADAVAVSGTSCRASAGVCDPAETCNGSAVTCPANAFASSATVCRAQNGACDVDDKCSGSTAPCPADAFATSAVVCRPQNGVCDVADSCTGLAPACPVDVFSSAATVCRIAVAGGCDVPESCPGSSGACPSDIHVAVGTQCRGIAGPCDVAESCTGAATCPSNGFVAAGTECGEASCDAGSETLATACTGLGIACPAPVVDTCDSYICGADACLEACLSSSDCASGFFCQAGGTCQPKKNLGGTCTNDGMCADASCVDGVCCDGACEGQCEACDMAGLLGTCSPATGAPHGDRGECASDDSLCGGECDGSVTDACAYPDGDVACRNASCADGVATIAAGCNAAGACPDIETQDCGAFICSATACLGECTVDDDCDTGNFCNAGVCVDKREDGEACSAQNQCESAECVDGLCCNVACEGQCQACDVEDAEGTCSPVIGDPHGARPPCTSDGSLCGGQCDGAEGTECAFPGAAVGCRDASCTDGVATIVAGCNGSGACPDELQQTCTPFLCGPTECDGDCTVDANCTDGNYCSAGVCVDKHEPGDLCQGNNECASDFCTDGVCCESACNGQCEACDVTNAVGQCVPVTGDPHGARAACDTDGSECGGTCAGVDPDACFYPADPTTCREPSCEGGVATLESFCDGAGSCPAIEQQDCGDFACGATYCAGDCNDDTDCAEGNFCLGALCVPEHIGGDACRAANECASGNCVDGVCCDTTCEGQCQACDVADSEGTCTPVTGAPHGRRETCAGSGDCAGACDGTNPDACTLPGEDTVCGDASCAEGVATLVSTCDGIGACAVAETEGCEPYLCGDEGACMESCTAAGDCITGFTCEDGACVVKGAIPTPNDGGLVAVGGGCGCGSAGGQTSNGALWLTGALALVMAARRQRRPRVTMDR